MSARDVQRLKTRFQGTSRKRWFCFHSPSKYQFFSDWNVQSFQRYISPQIVKEIFQFRHAMFYQFRKKPDFQIPSVHLFSGTETRKFLGTKILEILPHEIKQLENFREFKKAKKEWKATSCLCRLCKTYVRRLRFIWYRFSHICFSFYHYLLVSNYLFHFSLSTQKVTM